VVGHLTHHICGRTCLQVKEGVDVTYSHICGRTLDACLFHLHVSHMQMSYHIYMNESHPLMKWIVDGGVSHGSCHTHERVTHQSVILHIYE